MAMTLVTVACGMYGGSAKAGLPVFDYSNFTTNLKDYFEKIAEWKKTVEHYKGVIDHYTAQVAFWETQYNKIASLNLDLLQLEQDFKPIDADYGVDVMCPGASTSVIDKVTSSLVSIANPNADVVGEQQKICVKIVRTKNRKYNDTVQYLTTLGADVGALAKITELRASLGGKLNPGDTQGIVQETQRYSSKMQLDKERWETSMRQYDSQIKLLEDQQIVLSRRALRGKPSLWGTLVNTAVLQGALSVNK